MFSFHENLKVFAASLHTQAYSKYCYEAASWFSTLIKKRNFERLHSKFLYIHSLNVVQSRFKKLLQNLLFNYFLE